MLELDLVFEKFWAKAGVLGQQDVEALERLLAMPDNDLLDLMMGRAGTNDPGVRAVVDKIKAA